jgi:hypothetical protein
MGPMGRFEDQRPGDGRQQAGDCRGQQFAHLVFADLLVEAPAPQFLHQLARRRGPQIGRDKQILKRCQGRLVEAALDQDAGDALAQARGAALEAGGEPAEPADLRGHDGPVTIRLS